MNILSKRLYKALESPATTTIKPIKSYHPSSASIKLPDTGEVIGSCLRQQYYRMVEPIISNSQPVDYKIAAIMGDQLHEMIANFISTYGFAMKLQLIDVEHSFFYEDFNLSGRCDIIAWDHDKQEPIGIEIKTVGEYKASMCIERPAPEHVMQAMIYLHVYNKLIPVEMVRPKKWYVWYLARNDSWSLKSKKHGSPFSVLWDFYVTLDHGTGIPTVYTPVGKEEWSNYNINSVLARYKDLDYYIQNTIVPPRDYEIQYSEDKIVGLHKQGKLTRKVDKEKIDKWLDKGAKKDKLKLEMGDKECDLCNWKDKCWGLSNNTVSQSNFNLPKINNVAAPTPKPSPDISIL